MASIETEENVSYNLKLSQEELDSLYLVLCRVRGCPYTSPRFFTDKIFSCIETHSNFKTSTSAFEGVLSLDFRNNPESKEIKELIINKIK